MNHFVVRHVGLDSFAKPDVPTQSARFGVGFDAEEVAPVVEELGLHAWRFNEGVDEVGPLFSLVGIEEGFRLFGGRKASDDIEVAPADEDRVVSDGHRSDFLIFLFGEEDFVDFAGGISDHLI